MSRSDSTELDAFDLRILARYQTDTRIAAEAIGRDIGLSVAAVQRRLKRMRDEGIIEREVAQIAPAAVGLALTCVVLVDIDRESPTDLARFKSRMLACPQVQQCYYVTGSSDYVLVVLVPDMAAYEIFTREHLLSDDNVRSFTTHVVMDRIKTGNAVFIDLNAQ